MKRRLGKVIFWIISGAVFFGILWGGFMAYKLYSVGKKVSFYPKENSSFADTLKVFVPGKTPPPKGEDRQKINILLLGIAGKGKPGQNLTDTIMVASINTQTGQTALMSLPRDLWVEVPDQNFKTKINSIYQIGFNSGPSDEKEASELIRKAVQDITSLPIDYYAVLNFDGFEKAIDAVAGINIQSDWDIFDSRYPGPNYSYETFELKKGFHHLDGATALKYARVRHGDPEGDFGRAKRQQQIMQAFKNKVFSIGSMLNVFSINELADVVGENLRTDIRPEEFDSFIELVKKIDTNNLTNSVVGAWDRDSLLKVSHIATEAGNMFVLIPRAGNWSEIQDLAQNIFDQNAIARRREEIEKENASIAIINKSGEDKLTEKIKRLLRDNFGYKNVTEELATGEDLEDSTTAFDLTGSMKPFTLDELVAKLPARASYDTYSFADDLPEKTTPDFVVILGKDIVSRYDMEEDSFEDYKNAKDSDEYTEFRTTD